VRVLLSVDEQWTDREEAALVANLHERFGQGAEMSLEYCDDIQPSASGKYRYVISELSALTDPMA
jgi:hypothetical protein